MCTVDSCNPATGVVHTAISVDDGNACTIDVCDASGVSHVVNPADRDLDGMRGVAMVRRDTVTSLPGVRR